MNKFLIYRRLFFCIFFYFVHGCSSVRKQKITFQEMNIRDALSFAYKPERNGDGDTHLYIIENPEIFKNRFSGEVAGSNGNKILQFVADESKLRLEVRNDLYFVHDSKNEMKLNFRMDEFRNGGYSKNIHLTVDIARISLKDFEKLMNSSYFAESYSVEFHGGCHNKLVDVFSMRVSLSDLILCVASYFNATVHFSRLGE